MELDPKGAKMNLVWTKEWFRNEFWRPVFCKTIKLQIVLFLQVLCSTSICCFFTASNAVSFQLTQFKSYHVDKVSLLAVKTDMSYFAFFMILVPVNRFLHRFSDLITTGLVYFKSWSCEEKKKRRGQLKMNMGNNYLLFFCCCCLGFFFFFFWWPFSDSFHFDSVE